MDKETFTIRLENANGLETPEGLKAKIQNKINIPPGHQVLIFDKRMLGSGSIFLDYGIQNKSILTLEDTTKLPWAISRDEVFLGHNTLGKTIWDYVTEAICRRCFVAAKCRDNPIISDYEHFAQDMTALAECYHENIVKFIGAVPNYPAIIVVEFMDTTLCAALKNKRITPSHYLSISMDVAQGLFYLHSIQLHHLIYRNVRAPNVFLKVAGFGWKAKLSDIGSTHFTQSCENNDIYAAPELQEDLARPQIMKADVYSHGVLLIELIASEIPTGSIETLVRSVQSRSPHFVPLITKIKCTSGNPNQRPTMGLIITQLKDLKDQ